MCKLFVQVGILEHINSCESLMDHSSYPLSLVPIVLLTILDSIFDFIQYFFGTHRILNFDGYDLLYICPNDK